MSFRELLSIGIVAAWPFLGVAASCAPTSTVSSPLLVNQKGMKARLGIYDRTFAEAEANEAKQPSDPGPGGSSSGIGGAL